ncbi:MAG TPA: hypothetical protein VF893_05900, partial [Candidatus Bathyarchaeia archaeon]
IETGAEVWKMPGGFRQTCWGGKAMIADSIVALQDTYDQRVYALGKGPSAVTVEAPLTAVTLGTSLVIRGKVTDVSPGTKSDELALRFPNGVPAVSDASMSEWMKYVYMQFPQPIDTRGVEVRLSVLDANNNYREIGTATGNSDGFFTFNWTPDIEGQYTVYASFEGSASYWPSHGVTSFAVDHAPAAPAEPEPAVPSMADTFFLPAVSGFAVALIVVIVLLAMLLLKKRP